MRGVDLFPCCIVIHGIVSTHVETVVLLSKLKSTHHIEVEIKTDEMDLTKSESKAAYDEIKQYVFDKYGISEIPEYAKAQNSTVSMVCRQFRFFKN